MRIWFLIFILFILGAFAFLPFFEEQRAKFISPAEAYMAERFFAIEPYQYPVSVDPVVSEDRRFATSFRPILDANAAGFAVPSAHAAVILDAETGKVLFEEDAHVERQIASLTKLFTALIVVERVKNLDELVTITEESLYVPGTRVGCPGTGNCTSTRMQVGEKVSVRNLLHAALMFSANDAATALGVHVGGSVEGFAAIMNARAAELGLRNSHFCTPSGLEPDGRENECYSSAYDVSLVTREALRHDELWAIMRTQEKTFSSADGRLEHVVRNTNQLLGTDPYLLGTKTGFTPLAGYSLLAAFIQPATHNRIVTVVLDDQNRWQSIQEMFDWSNQAYRWQ